MTDLHATPVFAPFSPAVRRIAPDSPWIWLQKGFADFSASWRVSLAYGLLIICFSWIVVSLLAGAGQIYLLLPMCAGFMLVAPLGAVGLYETSRRLSIGQPASLAAALTAVRKNALQIASMGVVLLLLLLFWIRLATLLFALFFAGVTPDLSNLVPMLLHSPVSLPFLITGTALGGVLALIAYAISVISIPMLLDRDTNVFAAIATSIKAVRTNPKPMLLWAFIIVFFTGLGMATLFLGLAIIFPLIGHASWHAYRDLVERV